MDSLSAADFFFNLVSAFDTKLMPKIQRESHVFTAETVTFFVKTYISLYYNNLTADALIESGLQQVLVDIIP